MAWAETEEHRARVKEAREIIFQALMESNPYLAFSGGKDSTVLLHLVAQQSPAILVVTYQLGSQPSKIVSEYSAIAKQIARNYELWLPGSNFWVMGTADLARRGYNAVFVGLRAEEAIGRRNRIRAGRSITCHREYWPLQNWRWQDVWAYITANTVPYLSYYDLYAPVVGYNRLRFSGFFGAKFLSQFGKGNLDGVLMWRERYKQGGKEGEE